MHSHILKSVRVILARMDQTVLYIIALTMAVTFPLTAVAQNILSLAEAQQLAVDRSRQLAGQDLAVAANRDMAVSAAQNPDPVLSVGIDNLPLDGADQYSLTNDSMTQRRIGLSQEFTRGDKKRLRGERYDREVEKILAEKASLTLVIQRDTALAWLDRYYAEAGAALISEQIRQSQNEIEAAQTAYRAGRGNLSDVLAARTALVGLRDRDSETVRKLRMAKIALVREIGEPGELPLEQRPPIDNIPIDIDSLEKHVAMHPEIVILSKQENLALTEAHLAQANRQADWSVEVSYAQRGSQYSNMASIGISFPLQWDHTSRQDREVTAKFALAEQAREQREEVTRVAIAEVRGMVAEWESARERQARLEHELVPLAAERTQSELSAYRSGKSSLNNVLEARRNEVDARLQALQMEAEAARLWAQLNFHFLNDHTSVISHQDTVRAAPEKDTK